MEEEAEPGEELQAPIPEDSSGEEDDAPWPHQEAGGGPALKRPRVEQQQPLPGAKRLWYKQPPPAAYLELAAAPPKKVLKRLGMLKRPAARRAARPTLSWKRYRAQSLFGLPRECRGHWSGEKDSGNGAAQRYGAIFAWPGHGRPAGLQGFEAASPRGGFHVLTGMYIYIYAQPIYMCI